MTVFLFIIYLSFLIFFCFSLANFLIGFSLVEKLVTWFLIISADTILVLEIASPFKIFDQPVFLILIQGVFAGAVFLVNRRFHLGFPDIKDLQIKQKLQHFSKQIRSHRWLTAFALVIGLNYALLTVCILLFPQNITDTLYNHLSRIGYWIQQGSLEHYSGFNTVGMTYPYNNSLLMSLPIIFLKTDRLAGFTQLFAAIVCMLSVYLLSTGMGFKKKNSLIAALIILTYPIIIYESITAQNDLLVSAFCAVSFAMLVSFINTKTKRYLIFSLLSLALALGTKQYTLIIFPAYFALFIYGVVKTKAIKKIDLLKCFIYFVISFFLFGSYSYIQNMVNFGSPFGPKDAVENYTHISNISEQPEKIYINTSRLLGQFISCDGLPPGASDFCLEYKERILTPILPRVITSERFLYNPTLYDLSRPNFYNADYAWYGPLSWLLILPSFFYGLIRALRYRKHMNLILLLAPLTFFIFMQFSKSGWDPYQGRYYILAVVLIQPFTAWIFESKNWVGKCINILIGVSCVFIAVYSTLNNNSLPLISTNRLVEVERWGGENSEFVSKIAYKLKPYVMADRDVWSMSEIAIMTKSDSQYETPVELVERFVPIDGSLGIISDFTQFPDYLLRGSQVRRTLERITLPISAESAQNVTYILLAPEYEETSIPGFVEIGRSNHWVLLEKNE